MIGLLILGCVNLYRWFGNTWLRLFRRRVDYVQLELSGGLPELPETISFVQRRVLRRSTPLSLQELRRRLQRISDDPNTKGIILKLNGLEASWATLQSLRDELAHFRSTGKRVVAYVMSLDNADYYVACATDEIIAPPTTTFSIIGLRSEVRFLKDALEKVGISAVVESVSPYKSAGEQFINSDISSENREQLERLLDQRFNRLVQGISEGRTLSPDAVRSLIDQAPFSGKVAFEHGLVDALRYEDEFEEHFTTEDRKPIIMLWDDAESVLRKQYARIRRKLVGVVTVEGAIMRGASRELPVPLPLLGGQQAGSDTIIQAIRQAERNRRIAAIILYVNSPGGDAFASDLIWREALRLQQKKPVVVVMGDAAASGGYYIAAPAASIIAQPGTITGSIGVVSLRPVAAGLLEQAGINTVVLSRGANSGLLSIGSEPTESERLALRTQMFSTYSDFKQRVVEGRGIDEEQLEPIAGGRVWTGAEALEHGLVDQLGGLPDGLLRAQELAEIPQDRTAPLLIVRGGKDKELPQPFLTTSPAEMLDVIEDVLRPRVWSILPFEGL
ncbi:MAG: S49 family peptidase [Chloroflexota bacterium]